MIPKFHTLPIVEQWDCHGCTVCCRETTIRLTPDDLERLAEQGWGKQQEYQGVATVRRSWLLGGAKVLAHKRDGSCIFLTGAGRCRIHEVYGFEAKPYMCRLFPLQVVPSERELIATVVRSCPSAAADRGRPIKGHLPFLKTLIGALGLNETAAPPPIVGRILRSWDDFERLAKAVEQLVIDERLPLVRRVVHSIRFCNLLEQCKLKRVAPNELEALIEAIRELACSDAGYLFEDRQSPQKRTAKLFRRLGAHFIRCTPGGTPQRTLRDQWRAMRLSGTFARGPAMFPQIHPRFSAIELEKLERPLGPLAADVLEPLDRFYAAHALSKRYSLSPPGGSLVDGARRLAFAFPMALWMLRWLSDNREPTTDDMVQIVVGLERGLVLPGLNEAARYLAASGELERLIAWYGR